MAPRKTTADDVLAFDFGQLETEQLNSLSAKLQGIVSDRKEQDKQDFINEVREKAIAKGLDIGEILGQLNKSKGKIRTVSAVLKPLLIIPCGREVIIK